MARRSTKSVSEILAPRNVSSVDKNDNPFSVREEIAIASEGFTTHKFCELALKDRNRLHRKML
jgi:hypothetical protein